MGRHRTIVEVLHDRRRKYEVVRIVDDSPFGSTDFYILRDGKQVAGSYSTLRDAIAWAERQGALPKR